MKKLITYGLIGIISVLFFSACSSKISLTKRHYQKGYYFSHNKGKRAVQNDQTKNKLAETKIYTEPSVNQTQTKPNTNQADENLIASNDLKTDHKVKGGSKTFPSSPNLKPELKVKNLDLSSPAASLRQALYQSDHDHSHHGHSLFWIIILVILILWLLGFLSGWGTGGLINLLLLIALILFILWLFRVI